MAAGTLIIDNLESSTGGNNRDTDDLIQGACTAWVNFNGTGTVAIRDSFNVSSITDNAVGQYVVNFANNMATTNYAMAGSAGTTTASGTTALWVGNGSSLGSFGNADAVGSSRLQTTHITSATADASFVKAAFFGGL